MQKPVMPMSFLSAKAKAALAVWLAQAPIAPGCAQPDHQALCARLATSAKRSDNHWN